MNEAKSAPLVIHRAASRGFAHHGWLESAHSFSFADYHDPERMGFGALRVLNDDWIQPGMGFDTHPHRHMEIITVPLEGVLRHKDSEGHEYVLRKGDIQVMSAGRGIAHSEYNASNTEPAALLQIWVIPNRTGTPPSYQQRSFDLTARRNRFQLIVSPEGSDGSLKILQDARLALAHLDAGTDLSYRPTKAAHGVYFFLIGGALEAEGETFAKRDAFGLQGRAEIPLRAKAESEVLAIEVPV